MVAHIQVDFGNTRQYRKLQSSVSRMNQTRVLSNSERDITNVVRSMLKTSAVRNPDAGFLAKVFKLWRGSSFAAFMLLHLHNANCQSPASRDRTSVEVQVDSQLPLSNFQKLTSGTWTVTASSGTKMYHTWKWGPGRHSVERWTTGENAKGDPWAEMIVYYWHPQDKKIRFLGLSPFASGINTGEIAFDGSTAVADSILSQTTGKREMQTIWRFTASDKYTETLLEKSPTGSLSNLSPWNTVWKRIAWLNHVRSVRMNLPFLSSLRLTSSCWAAAGPGVIKQAKPSAALQSGWRFQTLSMGRLA